MHNLPRLAELIRSRNTVENNIAHLIEHPVNIGSVGDYIASTIFGITLIESATHKEFAGIFAQEPLVGKSVDVQWHLRRDGDLSLKTDPSPDYYLVFAGPKPVPGMPHGYVTPWIIESVFLFDAKELLAALRERGVQIGTRTSVIGQLWDRAEIFPVQRNTRLLLSDEQRRLLALFGGQAPGAGFRP
ncbi:MAG TPA: hypothetical protein VFA09_11395 [Ktedonobacteraceae bacterium]|nr:hypothetical protein [Ktedonobacteraceae bacterium]